MSTGTAYELRRSQLDRIAIDAGGRVRLGCTEHPESPTVALYQDGSVRVLCGHCGFEAARVKVAGEAGRV